MSTIPIHQLHEACRRALLALDVDERSASALAHATVEAERVGNSAVGLAHLFDYLDGFRTGRIDRRPRVVVESPAPTMITADAGGGIAQYAFGRALPDLLHRTREYGMAALWIRNSFTVGELGYYPRTLANEGLIAVAMANSPALMSIGGSSSRILGTNPIAYGYPQPGRLPLVIDQASSATAFVNIRKAAERQESIPRGWALDHDGRPTEDAAAAVDGALLPFGSHRGGNIALLIELLATLAGGSFSIDAPPFDSGSEGPGIGAFLLALDPTRLGSGDRAQRWLQRITAEHGVRLPALELETLPDQVDVDDGLVDRLNRYANPD